MLINHSCLLVKQGLRKLLAKNVPGTFERIFVQPQLDFIVDDLILKIATFLIQGKG